MHAGAQTPAGKKRMGKCDAIYKDRHFLLICQSCTNHFQGAYSVSSHSILQRMYMHLCECLTVLSTLYILKIGPLLTIYYMWGKLLIVFGLCTLPSYHQDWFQPSWMGLKSSLVFTSAHNQRNTNDIKDTVTERKLSESLCLGLFCLTSFKFLIIEVQNSGMWQLRN